VQYDPPDDPPDGLVELIRKDLQLHDDDETPEPAAGETVLEEAARLVAGDRQAAYDHPLPNHRRIALLWNAFLAARYGPVVTLTAEDVVWMMIAVKQARDAHAAGRDNLVDVAGYARCLERMRAAEGREGGYQP